MEKNKNLLKIDALLHGYELSELIRPTKNMIDVCNEINDFCLVEKEQDIKKSSKTIICTNAEKFMRSKFKLHKVYCKRFLSKLDDLFCKFVYSDALRLDFVNRNGIYLDPFCINISFEDVERETLLENLPYTYADDVLKRIKPSVYAICLGRFITELSESSYVHEITHTQFLEYKGIIKNYFNCEVLPIFMELLNVYESGNKNLIAYINEVRFDEMFENIVCLEEAVKYPDLYDEFTLYEYNCYAESIVKAYRLFIEYLQGSISFRKYIIKSIQHIFDGRLQLEEFLDGFGITFDSCFEDEKFRIDYDNFMPHL